MGSSRPAGRTLRRYDMRTRAGDEAPCVIAGLHVLPELEIGVVEDVGVHVQIVKALRREHHAHVVPGVKQRQCAQKEDLARYLVRIKDAHQLVARDRDLLRARAQEYYNYYITRSSCREARCVCRQAAVRAAKILPLVGLARFKQDPIKGGHSAQYLHRPPPAGQENGVS